MTRTLDIGARNRSHGDIGLDLKPFSDVDVVGNGTELPFKDNTFEAVYADQVLEHLTPAQAEALFAEVYRVLETNGRFKAWTPIGTHFLHDPTHINEWRKANLEWITTDGKKIDYGYPPFDIIKAEYELWWEGQSLLGRSFSWTVNSLDKYMQRDSFVELPGVSGVFTFELEVPE